MNLTQKKDISMDLAPVLLFVYNRPEHTKRTLSSLAANDLADQSRLIVFSDGPKNTADEKKVLEVREIIEKQQGFREKEIVIQDKNIGLREAICNGITAIFNHYERLIILEDDLETSPAFLNFMNTALEWYADEERVMHVSGYWFPVSKKYKMPKLFFYAAGTCWGWGTWRRAWHYFNHDAAELKRALYEKGLLDKFTINGASDFMHQLDANIDHIKNTWAIKWYASIVLNDGLSLHPGISYVNNTGNDESGTNCQSLNCFYWPKLNEKYPVNPVPVTPDRKAPLAYGDFFRKCFRSKVPMKAKVRNLLGRAYHCLTDSEEQKIFRELEVFPRFIPHQVTMPNTGTVKFSDSVSFSSMYKEIFIENVYQFYTDNPRPYIIDCGANIGLSTMYFSHHHPNADIIAFEPDPCLFEILQENLEGLGKAQLVNSGLWKFDGKLSFESNASDGGKIDEEGEHSISVVRLSQYLNRKVDFLKIDIEGAEYEVLSECQAHLHNVERIFIEYHSFASQNQLLGKMVTMLEEAGFRVYCDVPGFRNKHPFLKINSYKGMDQQINLYCVR